MRPIPCLIAAALLCLPALPARADVIDPDVAQCSGKKAGDACSGAPHGACKEAECCRRRYLGNGPDGPRTKQVCSPCLRCTANARKKAPKPAADAPDLAPDLAPQAPDQAPDLIAIEADAAPDLAQELAPDLAPDLAPPAPDMSVTPLMPATEEPAPQVARKTSGGMCASAPWESQTGAGSLLVGALLALGLMRARRPR